uniref:Uncharacterized protein n=1 Tax=Nelumbo nucifera TaxID=4432 RepID=A0A822XXM0_NELNU|nr:TPA_asm: hypothetical protein HUJ06_025219 [Nelumbo nucifera]
MLDLVMDLLEDQCSESVVATKEEETSEKVTHLDETKVTHLDETKVESNGPCVNEIVNSGEHVEIKKLDEANGKGVETDIGVEIPSNTNESPGVVEETPLSKANESSELLGETPLLKTNQSHASTPPSETNQSPGVPGGTSPTTKGFGLKKWRRIRRDLSKDAGSGFDSNRILKRGLSNAVEPGRSLDLSAEIKEKSEASVASVNSSVQSPSVPIVFAAKGSTSDSRLAMGAGFPVGTDSENSEDRSSKSSTATSVPKLRYDVSVGMGSVRDKNKVKNLGGKSLGNAVQRSQQGKGRIDTSKKLRGERVKIEKENSFSSLESDSRNYNAVLLQMGSSSVVSNGRQSEISSNCGIENRDDTHVSDPQSSEEVQTGYCKENGKEVEDVSQDDVAADVSSEVKEEEADNHRSTVDQDPLIQSVFALQHLQEILEGGHMLYEESQKALCRGLLLSWHVTIGIAVLATYAGRSQLPLTPLNLPDDSREIEEIWIWWCDMNSDSSLPKKEKEL